MEEQKNSNPLNPIKLENQENKNFWTTVFTQNIWCITIDARKQIDNMDQQLYFSKKIICNIYAKMNVKITSATAILAILKRCMPCPGLPNIFLYLHKPNINLYIMFSLYSWDFYIYDKPTWG